MGSKIRSMFGWALAVLTVSTLLGGCAQARSGLAGKGAQELWEPQALCVNTAGAQVLACVDIQLNITDNLAYIDVQQLGFDPATMPYRVYARRSNESTFSLLADNVTVPAGGSFQVNALNNVYIEEYQEWIIEVGSTLDPNGFVQSAQPLQGTIAARAIIQWPELANTAAISYKVAN